MTIMMSWEGLYVYLGGGYLSLPISKYVGVPMWIRNFPMLAGPRLLTSKIASHQSTTRDTEIHMMSGSLLYLWSGNLDASYLNLA